MTEKLLGGLTRDYIKNPLKILKNKRNHNMFEKPSYEDLNYLYNECNYTLNDLYNYFSYVSHHTIQRWIKYYNIKKDIMKRSINVKQTLLERYGNETFNNREKYRQTNLDRYGEDHPLKTKQIKDKMRKTCLERYGVENPSYSEDIKNIIRNKIPTIQVKMRKTCLERYGVESIMQSKSFRDKRLQTMIKNKSFNKSKGEDIIYRLLNIKYGEVKRQYKSKLYPFNCDFYVPSIDTYIEYQGFYMHGKEPYIETDKQKEIIKLWESKNTPQYKRAIDTWTVKDPLKRKAAKDNNLKWLEFFNMDEFMKWFNQQ